MSFSLVIARQNFFQKCICLQDKRKKKINSIMFNPIVIFGDVAISN